MADNKQHTYFRGIGTFLGVAAALLPLIAAVFAIIFPVYLLIASICLRLKNLVRSWGLKGKLEDYWLDNAERITFTKDAAILAQQLAFLDAEERRADDEACARNADGRVSIKSYKGKEIRGNIDRAGAAIDALKDPVSYLSDRPFLRWDSFNQSLRHEHQYRYALFGWAAAVLGVSFSIGDWHLTSFVALLQTIGTNSIAGWDHVFDSNYSLAVTLGSACIAGLVFAIFCCGGVIKKPATRYTPEPGRVDLQNVDHPSGGTKARWYTPSHGVMQLMILVLGVLVGIGIHDFYPNALKGLHGEAAIPTTPVAKPSAKKEIIPMAEVVEDNPVQINKPEPVFIITGLAPVDTLNVRAEPSASSEVVATFSNNTAIFITGAISTNGDTQWLEVRLDSKVGWISRPFVLEVNR